MWFASIGDNEKEKRIEGLEERLEKIEKRVDSSVKDGGAESDDKSLSRRGFLKKAEVGATALGAGGFTADTSALNFNSDLGFSFSGSGAEVDSTTINQLFTGLS